MDPPVAKDAAEAGSADELGPLMKRPKVQESTKDDKGDANVEVNLAVAKGIIKDIVDEKGANENENDANVKVAEGMEVEFTAENDAKDKENANDFDKDDTQDKVAAAKVENGIEEMEVDIALEKNTKHTEQATTVKEASMKVREAKIDVAKVGEDSKVKEIVKVKEDSKDKSCTRVMEDSKVERVKEDAEGVDDTKVEADGGDDTKIRVGSKVEEVTKVLVKEEGKK